MTVICWTHTPEGFAIGADGRRLQADGTLVTESAQKVFLFQLCEDVALAYAWTGNVRLDFGAKYFDFIEASKRVLEVMRSERYGCCNSGTAVLAEQASTDPAKYLEEFACRLFQELHAFLGGDVLYRPNVGLPIPAQFAKVLLIGYYHGQRFDAELSLSHSNGILDDPYLDGPDACDGGLMVFTGSADVFSKWPPPSSLDALDKGVEAVRAYIRHCIDEPNSSGGLSKFGGHIHIAKVLPRAVDWVEEPNAG
jgi:hypothetical protein